MRNPGAPKPPLATQPDQMLPASYLPLSLLDPLPSPLALWRPLRNVSRLLMRGRSCSLSPWERVGVRVFRATTPGLCKGLLWARVGETVFRATTLGLSRGFRWQSLAPFLLSWALRRPASPPTPNLPVPDPSNPRPRTVIPSARVAPRALAARRPPLPWRCELSPQNRVNPAKNSPKLSLASRPSLGAGWPETVPPFTPHQLPPHPRPAAAFTPRLEEAQSLSRVRRVDPASPPECGERSSSLNRSMNHPTPAAPKLTPKSTPRSLKSFLEKTLTRTRAPNSPPPSVPAPIMAAPPRHGFAM